MKEMAGIRGRRESPLSVCAIKGNGGMALSPFGWRRAGVDGLGLGGGVVIMR